MTAYYNENDPKAAAWLRDLILVGAIAEGYVDERSIEDVTPNDLRGYNQCHFFAGIGGWSYALRLAGISDDFPVWTGSCPCQPFSAAGKRNGFADKRHLWPAWYYLIRECNPLRLIGEQVATALSWFDLVSTDLEAASYTVGAAVLGAHSVGAPHIRQRLYWLAHPDDKGLQGRSRARLYASERLPWASSLVYCTDEKYRPIPLEPAFFPVADGVSGRVAALRGYGNAIVPQVAATFIQAWIECGLN